MKRTLEHCSAITTAVRNGEGKPKQAEGKCYGYQKSQTDDEPCYECMNCKLNAFYEE